MDVWSQDGYRIQTHKISGTHRLLDAANVLITAGSFEKCQTALAESLATPPDKAPINFNIPGPTLGGKQFWGDEFYDRGWRIQRNVLSSHYRLLDPANRRQAWGAYDQCLREFHRLALPKDKASARPLVILLHGIFRAPSSFDKLTERLRANGHEVCGVSYPSTQASIDAHAAQVNRLLERLEGRERIHFVCHSMGGLVVRAALKERPDPRVVSMVTLATPHSGAIEADMLKDWYPYRVTYGPAGQQLITGSESYIAGLGPLRCPTGCIAGGKGNDEGYNPIIPGDDDGTVSVASALHEDAADTLVVEAIHSFIMNNERAIDGVARFLGKGTFRPEGAITVEDRRKATSNVP
jgi:pimeloyl-ACP methyl ester carboxylesterase